MNANAGNLPHKVFAFSRAQHNRSPTYPLSFASLRPCVRLFLQMKLFAVLQIDNLRVTKGSSHDGARRLQADQPVSPLSQKFIGDRGSQRLRMEGNPAPRREDPLAPVG